jgi:cytochrome c556
MRITTTIMTAVIAFAALSGVTISAQEGPTPEQQAVMATENRQAVFKLLGVNMGPIVGMARGAVPFDASIAERNARRIAMLAPMIPELVGAMDTREFDVETEALPVIWDNMDEFSERAADLVDAANTFADLAAGGDQAATLGGLRAFGGTCGNCHDSFRVDDD